MLLKKTTVAIACSLLLLFAVFVSLVIREETKDSDSTNLRSDDSSDLSSWFQTEGELIWDDEFNNKDLPYWSHAVQSDFSLGKENQDVLYYRDYSVLVERGTLIIAATYSNHLGVHSGSINTQSKLLFQYGTLEARIKVSGGLVGVSPSFWIESDSNKINILKTTPGNLEETAEIDGIASAQWSSGESLERYALDYEANLDEEYHIYKLDWTPTSVATYKDGDLLWEMDIEQASCPHCDSFHQPHYIAFSLAVIFSEEHETTSSTMTVDYVRLIDNGFAMVELI